MDGLKPAAREALDAFSAIADKASELLQGRGLTLEALAMVNGATAEAVASNMHDRNLDRSSNLHALRRKPTIARLVVADEHSREETIYITPNAEVSIPGLKLCSYLNNRGMGKLAALVPGDDAHIELPGGTRYFQVVSKLTFEPTFDPGEWDSRPAIAFPAEGSPLTIKSLRDLLRDILPEALAADIIAAWEAEDEESVNIEEGIKRATLTAMQLRIAPILDKIQDEIFRLPLDSRIALLGPPGAGKTTTMVRRLRQKLDIAHLDDDERALADATELVGLSHADSWLLFTPTELLRLYVKEALGKEGVAVHDERIKTWDDYRWNIARNDLGILRKGNRGGLAMPRVADDSQLTSNALSNQIAWFEAFDEWQAKHFIEQLSVEAERLREAADPRAAALGQRVADATKRAGTSPLRMLAELTGFSPQLVSLARGLGESAKSVLATPLGSFAATDAGFLDALSELVNALLRDATEDTDDEEDDEAEDDDGEQQPAPHGRRLIADVFRRAMRTLAIAQASGRSPAPRSRAGRVLELIRERDLAAPDLKDVGQILVLQRAAGRLAGAPSHYLRRMPQRYRRFRREMREACTWYPVNTHAKSSAQPAEIDIIMLAMLRAASAFERDRLLAGRLADRRPPMLDAIARLRRNQVLVDEMTDFSPVQLACMAALAKPVTQSLFLSGDFNQRLTLWGSRTEQQIDWVAPGIDLRRISITYRQSHKLAAFGRRLAALQGADVEDNLPDYSTNIGVDPVLGVSLPDDMSRARWLVARIQEIEARTDEQLPTIAVLVPDKAMLDPLTDALNVELAPLSLQAKAYSDGEAIGKTNDIRVFPIEHIKGLEFEAVFFVDVDQLADSQPALFDRYIYVGATRAATFLGLTCSGETLPAALEHRDLNYLEAW